MSGGDWKEMFKAACDGDLAQLRYHVPFPTLRTSLVILRVGVPTLFMAHAVVRIVNGTMPQFAAFLGGIGFPQPLAVVWAITLTELVAGTMLALGHRQRSASIALASIAAGGIALIHHRFGWFVGEHGSGGSEYSVSLLLSLLVLAAADAKPSRHATQQHD